MTCRIKITRMHRLQEQTLRCHKNNPHHHHNNKKKKNSRNRVWWRILQLNARPPHTSWRIARSVWCLVHVIWVVRTVIYYSIYVISCHMPGNTPSLVEPIIWPRIWRSSVNYTSVTPSCLWSHIDRMWRMSDSPRPQPVPHLKHKSPTSIPPMRFEWPVTVSSLVVLSYTLTGSLNFAHIYVWPRRYYTWSLTPHATTQDPNLLSIVSYPSCDLINTSGFVITRSYPRPHLRCLRLVHALPCSRWPSSTGVVGVRYCGVVRVPNPRRSNDEVVRCVSWRRGKIMKRWRRYRSDTVHFTQPQPLIH